VRPDLPRELIEDPFGFVRESCARVAERADSVWIDRDRLCEWSDALPLDEIREPVATLLPPSLREADDETAFAFVLQLDAVNFGSGWFPLLRKREGLSGYRSIEASLAEHFERNGAASAEQLTRITADDCRALFAQGHEVDELMELFAAAWRALGGRVVEQHRGRFARMLESVEGSSAALVRELLQMPFYHDVSRYDGRPVGFLKRAQITVSDLDAARPGSFGALSELTIFADNLVPHVLRIDGVLGFDPDLAARIDRGERLDWGTREEVEIRACAVVAAEEVAARLAGRATPRQLDSWLWTRGGRPEYKAHPRHRTRCVYY
jgi:hypothetical protein